MCRKTRAISASRSRGLGSHGTKSEEGATETI
jgi:hypothetical protein